MGLTRLGHDVRHTSSRAAAALHKHLIGENALAVTPGAAREDMMASHRVDPTVNLNRDVHSAVRRTTSVLAWTDQQQYLLKKSPTNVLLTADFGTG